MLTILSKVTFPQCLMFFHLFLPLGGSLKAGDQGRDRRHHLNLSLSVLGCSASLSNHWFPWQCNCQLFSKIDPDWPRQMWCWPHPPQCTSSTLLLISLWSNLGGMVEVAGVGWTLIWDNQKSSIVVSSKLKAKMPSSHRAEEHNGFLTMNIPQ